MFHGRRGVVAAVCLLFVTGCSSNKATPAAKPSPVIARVANDTITLADFNTRYNSALVSIEQGGASQNAAQTTALRTTVLGSLIVDRVIRQEAAAIGLEATPAEVQAQVAADAKSDGGMSALETDLAGAGGSIAQLEDEIASDLNEQRLEDNFAKARAATIEQQLSSGEKFSAAKFIATVKQYSDDTGTTAKGGDLGVLSKTQLTTYDPAFAAAVEGLAVGSYTTTPVHDAGGYDIVMLYSESSKGFGVRHILVYAGNPYDVMDRPVWFVEAIFSQIRTLCQKNEIDVTLTNAGGSPCTRALQSPTPAPASPKASPSP